MNAETSGPSLGRQTPGQAQPGPPQQTAPTAPFVLRRALTKKMVQTGTLPFNCAGSPAAERMLTTMLNVCGTGPCTTQALPVQVRSSGYVAACCTPAPYVSHACRPGVLQQCHMHETDLHAHTRFGWVHGYSMCLAGGAAAQPRLGPLTLSRLGRKAVQLVALRLRA